MNKALHFILPDSFSSAIFQRIQHLLPQELDGNKLRGLSSRLNCYKYNSGDRFRMHVDGDWPAYGLDADGVSMVEYSGMLSKISMLVYLNDEADGVQGGATRLYSTQGSSRTDEPVHSFFGMALARVLSCTRGRKSGRVRQSMSA